MWQPPKAAGCPLSRHARERATERLGAPGLAKNGPAHSFIRKTRHLFIREQETKINFQQ
jgi:hypothetical protein